jgi:glycosyltransferase involved in cell wall biosynthesis
MYRTLLIPAQLGIKRFISLSAATARQNCLEFGLKPEKVQVVHLGLDLSKFPFKFCENSRKIGIISRLSREKQVDLFVRAIPTVHKAFPEYRFLIAGDGPEKNNLEQLASNLNIDGIIDFVGWQNNVATILRELEIFVFTSSDEGLGWAMLEAMASGCPVVASCVGGIPEVIDDNENGMLVKSAAPDEFAEKIIYLISNPGQKKKMAITAREKIEKRFSAAHETAALEKIYCEFLGN